MIQLPVLDEAPFLAAAGPRDRAWSRVLAMAAAGLTFAFILGVVATGLMVEALLALGVDLMHPEAAGGPPRLIRSGLYVLEISLALGAAALGALIAAARIFQRPIQSWVTASARFRWGQLAMGFGLGLAGAAVLSQIAGLIHGGASLGDGAPILDTAAAPQVRLIYVVACAAGFLLAAWAEEAVFRGYVLQQAQALTGKPYLAILISGLLFSLIHLEFSPYALVARAIIGAAFAWTAIRLGGLEFAIGAHLANNMMIALFGQAMLPGDPVDPGDAVGVAFEIAIALYLAACAELIRRRSSP